jgi:hypothetical protein
MKIIPILLASVVLLPVSMVILLFNIYPYHPASLIGWVLLALLAIPIILAGEFLGDRLLGASIISKLPQFLRVTYGVIVMGGVMVSLIFGIHLLDGHLVKWGS